MNIEPATLTITGMIATVLSLVFAFAAHSTTKKRQRERAHIEAMLKSQREDSPVFSSTPAAYPSPAAQETPSVRSAPALTVTAERAPAPAPYAPSAPPAHAAPPPRPSPAGPPVFKQYLTRPGTKATTPVVEAPPTDKDYVWE